MSSEFASNNSILYYCESQRVEDRLQVPSLILEEGQSALRVVHISDTHDRHSEGYLASVPRGDILIHSGDFTNSGTAEEIERFRRFLQRLPHTHKIIVCGNHEIGFDSITRDELLSRLSDVPGLILLQDSGVILNGVSFWGSSWNNCQGKAWGVNEKEREEKWKLIPRETDVIITHNPPFGILDLAWIKMHSNTVCNYCGDLTEVHGNFVHWGCPALRRKIVQMGTIKLHCFGHVHDQPGVLRLQSLATTFSNAAQAFRGSTIGNVFDLVKGEAPQSKSENGDLINRGKTGPTNEI